VLENTIRRFQSPAVRKERAFPDRLANAPVRPFGALDVGPRNGWDAPESGLRLKAWIAPLPLRTTSVRPSLGVTSYPSKLVTAKSLIHSARQETRPIA
jgi:hypothetical protein